MNVPKTTRGMKPLGLQSIPIADIDASDRLRGIDEAYAQLLAENIRQTGRLRQPVEVRTIKNGRFRLIAGGHRLRAQTINGETVIDAFVFEATADQARLAEIDENLVRHDLNPLDRAVFLAERKALYEKLHPETKHGAQGGRGGQRNENDTMSFSKDTAERCGLDERTIQRAVMIASRLAPEIRTRIAGTWIARKQSELLALAAVEPSKRLAVIERLLAEDATVSTVKAAERLVSGAAEPVSDDQEKKVAALRKAWDRAAKSGRRAWLLEMQAEGRLDEIAGLLAEIAPPRPQRAAEPAAPTASPDARQIDLEEVIAARSPAIAEG